MRVLVVEDDADASEMLVAELLEAGHEVRAAFNVPAARRLAGTFDPDAVLIDLGLPVFDGNELARHLRRGTASPLLIAVTGTPERADEELFDAVLPKPLRGGELASALHDTDRAG